MLNHPNSDKKIFFFCQRQGTPECAAFQHSIIVIAEGLRKLGISYYSDKNYWRLSPDALDCLFTHDADVTADDCDVVVVNADWMHYQNALPKDLFHENRKYVTVYIDDDDGLYTHSMAPLFRNFDVILRTHYDRKHIYPKNMLPWQFGFSERVVGALGEYVEYNDRPGGALCNFRMQHSVREYVNKFFLPRFEQLFPVDFQKDGQPDLATDQYSKMLWEQTGKRHYPNYFKKLKENKVSLAFGGYFSSFYPRSASSVLLRKINSFIKRFNLKTSTVTQFDSWRFWESLVAGCVTIHIDLAKYGAVLPVMPENWKHYVGIDLDDIDGSIIAIKNNLHKFPEIARSGREWVLSNYSPVSVAERFMKIVSKLP
ncbi:MAG: glycosyltransferase family 1 protein [Candidatus Taylorbacteria bacterium]|nr:glycosyltransferase family 1 protein [Candidatus Taylorbacteria bacterium]